MTPRHGGFAPWTPVLPTLVGLGFARVLGPTRGGVSKAGYSPLLLVLWGDTPHSTPRHGGFAPWTPVLPTPRWLGVRLRSGSHSWRSFQSGLLAPSFGFVGGHPPQPPAMGASPPWTPYCPPSLAEGSPAFWVPLVAGLQVLTPFPFLRFLGGTSPKPPGRGLRPLHPRFNVGA